MYERTIFNSRRKIMTQSKIGKTLDSDAPILILDPTNTNDSFYFERTDRNIGWITKEEQLILKNSVVGIAGCGGMGGLLASIFTRLGVGEIRIADSEVFDISNINRQFGAGRNTIDKSKALETARLVRDIANDTRLVIYKEGITEATVDSFLLGCDIVCDEIEVLAVPARILLHIRARKQGISLFNCNTVGFSTNLFLYEPDGMTMEEAIGLSYEESLELAKAANSGDQQAINEIVDRMVKAVVPQMPEYSPAEKEANLDAFYHRLKVEKKAPIIATNPPLAAGFLADRVLLYLLRNSPVTRTIQPVPSMPGFLHFDAANMTATAISSGWDPRS